MAAAMLISSSCARFPNFRTLKHKESTRNHVSPQYDDEIYYPAYEYRDLEDLQNYDDEQVELENGNAIMPGQYRFFYAIGKRSGNNMFGRII